MHVWYLLQSPSWRWDLTEAERNAKLDEAMFIETRRREGSALRRVMLALSGSPDFLAQKVLRRLYRNAKAEDKRREMEVLAQNNEVKPRDVEDDAPRPRAEDVPALKGFVDETRQEARLEDRRDRLIGLDPRWERVLEVVRAASDTNTIPELAERSGLTLRTFERLRSDARQRFSPRG